MSKGQELEDLSASQHLPQKERNQRTTLNVIKAEYISVKNSVAGPFGLKTHAEVGTILLDR